MAKRAKPPAANPAATEAVNREAIIDPAAVRDDAVAKPQHAGGKVTIACKVGVAYIDLQLSRLEEVYENTQTGPRRIKEARRFGPVVRIRGTAYPRGTPPRGFPPPPLMVGGAALNPGIDKDFWDAWREQNKQSPYVINGMIFAHESDDHVRGRALEESAIHSGLEPLDPDSGKDPRMPRATRSELTNIEGDKERMGLRR